MLKVSVTKIFVPFPLITYISGMYNMDTLTRYILPAFLIIINHSLFRVKSSKTSKLQCARVRFKYCVRTIAHPYARWNNVKRFGNDCYAILLCHAVVQALWWTSSDWTQDFSVNSCKNKTIEFISTQECSLKNWVHKQTCKLTIHGET